MNSRIIYAAVATAALAASWTHDATAQAPTPSKPEQAIQSSASEGKLIYILFYKEGSVGTKAMADAVTDAVNAQNGQSTSTYVRLTDDAERVVAERYQVTRAPMPMVIAVRSVVWPR